MGPRTPLSQARAATSVLLFGEPFLEVFLEPAFFLRGERVAQSFVFLFLLVFLFLFFLTGQKDTVTWEDGFLASSKSRGSCPLSTITTLDLRPFRWRGLGIVFFSWGRGGGLVGFWGMCVKCF